MSTVTTVTTVVTTPSTIMPLNPNPHASMTPSDIVDRFSAIVERFLDWQDSLSKQILKWGNETFNATVSLINNSTAFQQAAAIKINELVSQILLNPLDNTTLVEPWLLEGRVIEKKQLDQCYFQQGLISPYTQQITQATPTAHTFAIEILALLRILPAEILSKEMAVKLEVNSKESAALIPANITLPPAMQLLQFQSITLAAQKVINVEQSNALAAYMEQRRIGAIQFTAAMDARVQEETQKIQQQNAAHEQQMKSQVDTLEQTCNQRVAVVEVRVDSAISQNLALSQQLQSTQAIVAHQANQISQLQSSNASHQNEINKLKEKNKKGCVIM